MIGWFLKSLGVSEEIASHLDEVHWLWARPLWLWIGLALLVPAGWFIVARHRRNMPHVSPRARRALSLCRIGVLALLVVVLAGPYLRLNERVQHKPIVALVIDESSSMSLPAGPFTPETLRTVAHTAGLIEPLNAKGDLPPLGPEMSKKVEAMTRAELLDAALRKLHATTLKSLRDKYDLRVYRVARRVRRGELHEKADGVSAFEASDSALGSALAEAIDEAAGRPIAGIVLVSDGRNTTGQTPLSIVRRAGQSTDSQAPAAAPVFTVPVGSSDPAPDIVVLDALAPAEVAKDDTVAVTATLGSHGFDQKEVTVELRDGARVIDKKSLTLTGARRQQVQLSFTPQQPGPYVLTVAVTPQPQELVLDNNDQSLSVRVVTNKLKVLMLDSIPRWDFRFLDHGLRRDKGLDVTFIMESQLLAAGIKPQDLPATAKLPTDVGGWAQYHVVMLGDVSPQMLPPQAATTLVQAVQDKGVGLIVQAGTQHMPHDFLNSPVSGLLPMRIEPRDGPAEEGQPTGGIDAPAFKPFTMHITPGGSMHPAFTLYADAGRNRQIWSQMPTFFWAAKTVDARPGATLLAEVETEYGHRPLIAEHFVGRGRVLMLGTDETFRWRRNIGDQFFYRFWGQAVRHVARKKDRDTSDNWIDVNPRHVEPGSPIAVELFAVNPSGQPINDASVSVTVTDGKENRRLLLEPGPQPGHYRGVWSADAPGLFTFGYTGRDGQLVSATARVADSGRERRNPTVDRDTLGAVADASGGQLLELNELATLPQLLTGEAVSVDRRHESEVWDNWLVLVLLVGFYCTDVGIRRLLGLT